MQINELNILIAEDDDFQRNIIVEMLRSLGLHSIFEATNGHEALEIIRNADPKIDLIFSDLKMPKMDGMEFLRHLSKENHHIEIVILSAMDKKLLSTVNRVSSLYDIKLLGAIEKPMNLQQLKNILSKSGKTQTSPKPKQDSKEFNFSVEEILEGIRQKQFKPYLQPKVDLKTGHILGAEALARWLHPEHGVILPYAFIPKLEESKQIDTLTFMMLEESALACKSLLDKNYNLHIAVNLSLVSLNNPDIAEEITSVIRATGVDTKYIALEITESTAMTDAPQALENLARLYMNGFTLSIDDYGTGYSNLQQLTRVAFGELKIDRSLIQGIANNEAMLIVVASNIDMAHKLKIKSVAEGIETEQDWEMLGKMGCDIGQGYYIAKPMSIEDFYSFIDNYQALDTSPATVYHHVKTKTKASSEYEILVIEDDDFTRNIILQTLNSFGYLQTTDVADAQSAIDLFETRQFDLIITDIFMPNINGLELIKRIRTNKTLAKPNTRIIVLSGLTQARAVSLAMALNVNGLLVKPLIPNIMDGKIRSVMNEPSRIQTKIAYETVNTDIQGTEVIETIDIKKSESSNVNNPVYIPFN
jgi:EAL domain-containing protein (putative c-di-GMP-specific phosphodiesterase class I)/DNA-binding response OmpR family regulator